jgi:hypothetical protein
MNSTLGVFAVFAEFAVFGFVHKNKTTTSTITHTAIEIPLKTAGEMLIGDIIFVCS